MQNGKIRKTGWTWRGEKKGGGSDAISQLGRDQGRSRHAVRGGGTARPGRETSQPGPEPGQPAPVPEARARGHRAGQVGQWERCHVHGVPGPAQHHPRAGQGGDPVQPHRIPRGNDRPRHVDDVEVGPHEHPLRRRQGGSVLQPSRDVPPRAAGPHPAVHHGDRDADRPGKGYPGAGHVHRRADDGVDDGHLFDADGLLRPRCGDRKTARRGGLRGTTRGDRTGAGQSHRRRHRAAGASPRETHRGGAGVRERGVRHRPGAGGKGGEGARRERCVRGRSPPRRASGGQHDPAHGGGGKYRNTRG